MSHVELSENEKNILFWASFLSLAAAGVGFVFRSMVPGLWSEHFSISDTEVGSLFGAGLWPIAIMMILFSLIVDKVGYKRSMYVAFVFQALSVVMTITAESFNAMWWACIFAGLGHGVVEAVINPLCVAMYRENRSKWLNILHAAWPAGIVAGGTIFLTLYQNAPTWDAASTAFSFMLLPVLIYGVMFALVKRYPVDERVENDVSMLEMLREFGGLGAFLAITFIGYEAFTQLGMFAEGQYDRLLASFVIGALGGAAAGFAVKSKGMWMFFFLCLVMIPLATAELATDGWIRQLMQPILGNNAGWALVFSASIMMILRFFAGVPLKFLSPPGLLLLSSVFSIAGLFSLSFASGAAVFLAFVLYAVGQTFYWPTMLGFTSEQFPKGGAMTLNTVSAMGLLTVGIFGFPFLGAVQDSLNAKAVIAEQPALAETIKIEERTFVAAISGEQKLIYQRKTLFGVGYDVIDSGAVMRQPEFDASRQAALNERLGATGRSTLRVAAILPTIMAVAFILFILWFRSNGGYRPVSIRE